MSKPRMTALTAGLLAALAAAATADDLKPSGDVEPNVGKGRVVNTEGAPIPGVEVSLENTLFLGHAVVKTDKDGRYRAELTKGSFHVTARVTRVYHDIRYVMDCTPDNPDDFNGPDGGVRDFVWKLTGQHPDGLGTFGSPVIVNNEPGDFTFELKDVELTLVPDGPLIDGSKGKKITGKVKNSPDGFCIKDVPVGRYKVGVRLAPKGAKSSPLRVKVRNGEDDYADTVIADFTHVGPLDSLFKLDLEVKP